jgi:hypothetical protein
MESEKLVVDVSIVGFVTRRLIIMVSVSALVSLIGIADTESLILPTCHPQLYRNITERLKQV